jgi:hypothetical protein
MVLVQVVFGEASVLGRLSALFAHQGLEFSVSVQGACAMQQPCGGRARRLK